MFISELPNKTCFCGKKQGGSMNIIKSIIIIIMVMATSSSFSCEDTHAELTIEKAINDFERSFQVFAVNVDEVIHDNPKKKPASFVSKTRNKIKTLKQEINKKTDVNKRKKLEIQKDWLETELTIYQAESDLDKNKSHLGYDGSYDGQITIKTKVIESYKGDFHKNQLFSISELRRSWGRCNDFNNEYVYNAKVGDKLVIYLNNDGIVNWEKFIDKVKIDKNMSKVKKGNSSIFQYLLSFF